MVSSRWTCQLVLQIIRKLAVATLIERIAFWRLNPNERGSLSNMNISCAYCKEPLTHSGEAITVCSGERMYLFCSIGCRDLYGFRKLTNRICARWGCNNRVPEGNRMLCSNCHQQGNHLGEPEVSFDEAERAHWERMDRALHWANWGEDSKLQFPRYVPGRTPLFSAKSARRSGISFGGQYGFDVLFISFIFSHLFLLDCRSVYTSTFGG